jgi:hypothetical protein
MPWKFRRPSPFEKEIAALKTTIVCLRHEVENKQGYAAKLDLVVHERSERVDELNALLEQSRQQIQRLDLQNQILVEMIAAPPVDAAMLVPK